MIIANLYSKHSYKALEYITKKRIDKFGHCIDIFQYKEDENVKFFYLLNNHSVLINEYELKLSSENAINSMISFYNINQYYVVNPLDSQQEMVEKMNDYWFSDFGAEYNPDRKEAFKVIEVKPALEEVVTDIKKREGQLPVTVATDARTYPHTISYRDLREKIHNEEQPYLVLLGTGWGLTEAVMEEADYILEPIYGPGDYNHLSVRSAAAIILDRLLKTNGE